MARTILRSKGQLTLPSEARRALRLEEGDPIEVVVLEDGILLRPQKAIDASQAWFWEAGWQVGEREASAELEAGRGRTFKSTDEFLKSLEQ
jgi:AbrB family looped-hinge helix DNA binding protein